MMRIESFSLNVGGSLLVAFETNLGRLLADAEKRIVTGLLFSSDGDDGGGVLLPELCALLLLEFTDPDEEELFKFGLDLSSTWEEHETPI